LFLLLGSVFFYWLAFARAEATETTLFDAIQKEARGLTYQSESDHRVRAFRWSAATAAQRLTGIRAVRHERKRGDTDTEAFFRPMTGLHAWQTVAERRNAQGFRRLEELFRRRLPGARFYRARLGTRTGLILAGKTANGDWVGVVAEVVET
jgi:hypothetical protein